jgi:hypothetical protein
MDLEEKKAEGREKDPEAVEKLKQLREKLYSEDVSVARKAAYGLSWMQEDGLEILKEALLGNARRTPKKAAAYGLRSMHGRMKKLALEVLKEGLNHRNRTTKAACEKSLMLIVGKIREKRHSQGQTTSNRSQIRAVQRRSRRTRPTSRERH